MKKSFCWLFRRRDISESMGEDVAKRLKKVRLILQLACQRKLKLNRMNLLWIPWLPSGLHPTWKICVWCKMDKDRAGNGIWSDNDYYWFRSLTGEIIEETKMPMGEMVDKVNLNKEKLNSISSNRQWSDQHRIELQRQALMAAEIEYEGFQTPFCRLQPWIV